MKRRLLGMKKDKEGRMNWDRERIPQLSEQWIKRGMCSFSWYFFFFIPSHPPPSFSSFLVLYRGGEVVYGILLILEDAAVVKVRKRMYVCLFTWEAKRTQCNMNIKLVLLVCFKVCLININFVFIFLSSKENRVVIFVIFVVFAVIFQKECVSLWYLKMMKENGLWFYDQSQCWSMLRMTWSKRKETRIDTKDAWPEEVRCSREEEASLAVRGPVKTSRQDWAVERERKEKSMWINKHLSETVFKRIHSQQNWWLLKYN